MTGLRESVAKAIQHSEDCGGQGILNVHEIAALEWAIGAEYMDDSTKHHRMELAALLAELGTGRMRIHGLPTRIDKYFLQCADVAIKAYDDWLEQRMEATP